METGFELYEKYHELSGALDIETDSAQRDVIELELQIVAEDIAKKVHTYDYIITKIKEDLGGYEGRIGVLMEEVSRLRMRCRARENDLTRLNENIMLFVKDTGAPNKSGNFVVKTKDGTNYTVIKRNGPLIIPSDDAVPSDFVEQVRKVNRKEARQFIIDNPNATWGSVPKIDTLLRR
jgi:hypothetical protein|tara:strand:- start:3816 stop:4349 length:534 start_codon:yes stop_codon:yes gene_type:complete